MWLVGSIYLITIKHVNQNCNFLGTTNNEWLSTGKMARRLRALSFCYKRNGKDRKTHDSDAAIAVNYDADASFSSWSKSICNPEMGLQEFGVHEDYCLLSKVNTLTGHGYLSLLRAT